jgi:hypothetical protein
MTKLTAEQMKQRQAIVTDLAPLFQEAEATGKWFHCTYQDLWFSPAELRKEHAEGRFFWGAINWTLRDPKEMLEARAREAQAAADHLRRSQERVASA